jgi:hypothetical protein
VTRDDDNNNYNNNNDDDDNKRNVIKKKAEKILKHNRNSEHLECESKDSTGNNRGNWNHFNITWTVPEQHTRKAQN